MPGYACAIHIHTIYSDGTASIDDMIPWAQKAGIDVLLITDHHTMAGLRHGKAGWRDGVLVIVGYEHSDPRDENHLLIFGLDEPLAPTMVASAYVHAVRERGGVCFLAHPAETRSRYPRLRAYPWTASFDLPYDGIEVWNYLSSWAEGLSPHSVLRDYLIPDIHGGLPDERAAEIWDRVALRRRVSAIAGLDAHARTHRWGFLRGKVFPYRHGFEGIRTYVECPEPLSGIDPQLDTREILTHLAHGHSFMGNNRAGSLDAVQFTIRGGSFPGWGHTIYCDTSVEIEISMGARARVCAWRRGRIHGIRRGRTVRFHLKSPGIYRLSATRKGRTWFMTNHLRLETSKNIPAAEEEMRQ